MAPPKVSAAANSTTSKVKAVKTKKAVAGSKKPNASSASSHPSYSEMISDALITLKERNGSSSSAILKFIEGKQPGLPSNFKKMLSVQLKRLFVAGKLVKVKNSYKLSSESSKVVKNASLVKKKAEGKQVKASDKPNPKVGAKRKAESADKPTNPTKVAKSSANATPSKKAAKDQKPAAAKAKKPTVTKATKPAVGKVKKPLVKKPATSKVKKPTVSKAKKPTAAKLTKTTAAKVTKSTVAKVKKGGMLRNPFR